MIKRTHWAMSSAAVGMALSAHAAQPPDNVASDANFNTASGSYALYYETTGALNTALGYEALLNNTTGAMNTALGASALLGATTGISNTASGTYALHLNSDGSYNTASGTYSMYYNTSGYGNTATGYSALKANSSGWRNTAVGEQALASNTTADSNTAVGDFSMNVNSTGTMNVAVGESALSYSSTGSYNTAIGSDSLINTFTGSYNIAVGYGAGGNNTGGTSNNIDIGNFGGGSDSGIIRVGTAGSQTATFIAGISTSRITGAAVFVTSSGQLGVLASSRRYKTAIAAMGDRSDKLDRLRPVTFHLKNDPNGPLQFGLIAEEVDGVYPDLVIRDDAGAIQGVRYDELAPLLLNEVQKLRLQIATQNTHAAAQEATIQAMQEKLIAINARTEQLQRQFAELANQIPVNLAARATPADAPLAMR